MTNSTNADLLKRRTAVVPRGMGAAHPIFAKKAFNAEIWDVEGHRYIDFCAGIAVVNTGHCHPKVMAAAKAQLDNFSHTCFQVVGYEQYLELAEKLCEIAPIQGPKKAFFMSTGAEAVENAIKVARAYTKRSGIIAFQGGFHGRTMFSVALTGKVDPYKLNFGPFPAEVFHAQFPNPLHGISVEDAMKSLEGIFKSDIEPSRVAAIFIEPVQGEGGYLPAPKELMVRLRELCDKHGILLVADEIQTGVARTGKMFAMEHFGVQPDIITMAKGLAGGLTLSAIIGRAEVMDAPTVGGLGSTYAGHPAAIAGGLAVLEVVKEEKLCERSLQLGETIRHRFNTMKKKYPCIADVRGLGAMTGVEFCENGDINKPSADIANALKAEAASRKLLLLNCGTYANVLRVMIPLTIGDAVLNEGLDIIEKSLEAVLAKK